MPNPPTWNPTVHRYSLYGESDHLPDVVHCETIPERSVLHAWELAPHRHDRLHQLLLLRTGAGVAQLDRLGQQPGGETGAAAAPLPPMTLVNVPIGAVHAFTFEPGTDGLVITLADVMLDELLAHDPEVRRRLGQGWIGPADAAVDTVMSQLAQEYSGRSAARALVLRGLCATLLGLTARLATQSDPQGQNMTESDLLYRFETLLEAHFREHWGVADYAQALAVSPTHLSRVVRSVTGEPTSYWIDARVIREARRQLAFTHLSISVIADTLGFVDPALFSRVFTRVAGCSPRAFRQRLATG